MIEDQLNVSFSLWQCLSPGCTLCLHQWYLGRRSYSPDIEAERVMLDRLICDADHDVIIFLHDKCTNIKTSIHVQCSSKYEITLKVIYERKYDRGKS